MAMHMQSAQRFFIATLDPKQAFRHTQEASLCQRDFLVTAEKPARTIADCKEAASY